MTCGSAPANCAARAWITRRSPPLSAYPRVRCRSGCATFPARSGSVTRNAGSGRLKVRAATGPPSAHCARPRAATCTSATAEIGGLTERELIIAGAIAYWCEGTKNKPGRRADRVVFMNSDPDLIRFFLRFVEAAGTSRDDAIFRVCIHESANVAAAQRFWLEVTGASAGQFRTPALKHHNPKTIRKNIGDEYRGCLRIDVRRSSILYHRIEGWSAAIMSGG